MGGEMVAGPPVLRWPARLIGYPSMQGRVASYIPQQEASLLWEGVEEEGRGEGG